jgi:SAM-dependent methyltransferase
MSAETELNRRIAGVQEHYQAHPPHPGDQADARWIEQLPVTQVILGWAGRDNRVLDLGCHEGDISALIRTAGNRVVGVDLPEIAQAASDKHGLDTLGHDLNHPFPFEDASFDVVVCASVLDDIPDDLAHLRECCRVLRPGGRLIVVVPNDVSWFRRIQSLFGGASRDYSAPTGYHTLHCYTLKGIKTLMRAAGFEIDSHAKCPKRFSRIPLRYWIERVLPATFATDLAVLGRKPG